MNYTHKLKYIKHNVKKAFVYTGWGVEDIVKHIDFISAETSAINKNIIFCLEVKGYQNMIIFTHSSDLISNVLGYQDDEDFIVNEFDNYKTALEFLEKYNLKINK